jgi:hypothetical protein
VDPTPRYGDRSDARGLCGLDVERRVADIDRVVCARAEVLERDQQRVGVRLVPRRVLGADGDIEEPAELRQHLEGERERRPPLRRDDRQATPLRGQPLECVEDPRARLELVVEPRVVGAVDLDQLLHAGGVDRLHLLAEPRAADRREKLVLRNFPAQDGSRRVLEGGEDHRPGVDQGAVEVEQNGAVTHQPIVAARHWAQCRPCGARRS